ncbi:MAG: ATP-dependent helicase [Actinomycetales bacterium]|nr:ATP-dependent helicase [Actinomycetales bacterium]
MATDTVGSVAKTRFIPALHEQPRAHPLDASQRAILEASVGQSAVVLGAPGSGKTSTLKALIAHRVEGGLSPDDIIILTPGRQAANRLRDELATTLHSATNGALARTPMSLAFALAAEKATIDALDAPRLLTGSEQDQILGDLLEGHITDSAGPRWPQSLSPEVRSSRIFRTELRELFARCVDTQRLSGSMDLPKRLSELGSLAGRDEWVAAGEFWRTYIDAISEAKVHYFDSSEMVAIAALALKDPNTMAQTKLVVVDDAQELTYGAANMLRAFADRAIPVVMFGDPDVASTTFRGAVPNLLGQASSYLGVPVETRVLTHVHRHGATIRSAVSAVTDRIGAASAGTQRKATAKSATAKPVTTLPQTGSTAGPVAASMTLLERGSQSAEWAAVARTLREHHIFGEVPYSRMVVIVRNGGLVPQLARALAVNEVPSRTLVSDRSLRDQPIVRALISVVDVALGRAPLTLATTNDLLVSVLGGLSILDLRRLRLSLRHEELLAGGTRTGEELLPDSIAAPGRLTTIDSRPARRAARFSQVLADVTALGASGASIEELLWCVWEGSKLSDLWAADALGSGLVADDANRNLDSVMALFTSAKRFVEREPDRPAADFISELLAADIPEDTLAPQALGQSVLVCTPTAVVGAEYDVVVVASLQEGIWPNLRLRGSLLHPQAVVDAQFASTPQTEDPRKQVVEDELRMFALALSRATSHVVVSTTRDEDAQPSPFYRLLASLEAKANPVISETSSEKSSGAATDASLSGSSAIPPQWHRDLPRQREVPLSLRGLVGTLRRSLVESVTEGSQGREAAASAALAELARAQVAGASPDGWYGLRGPSTDKPLVDFVTEPEQLVNVSPSKLEAWEKNQLGWFISSTVGNKSSAAMGVGSLFHSVIEAVGEKKIIALSPDDLWQPIKERWHELSFEAPWESTREQRRAFKMVGALSSYLREFEASGAEVVAVECEFTVPVGHARLHGFIDRVEKDVDGNIVIVDLKTGAVPSGTNAEDHAQLRCYQFALVNDGVEKVEPGPTSGGARLLYLRGKEKTASAQASEREQNPDAGALTTAEQPYTYKILNQAALSHDLNSEGIDPIVSMQERIEKAALGMAGSSFTFVVYTREERGEYDSKYESRIHVIKAVSA